MEWRLPIEQQKPVAPSATERSAEREADFTESDEYRLAGGDPDLIELAFQARAYRENLLRKGRHL